MTLITPLEEFRLTQQHKMMYQNQRNPQSASKEDVKELT